MPHLIDTDVAIHLRDQSTAVVQRVSELDGRPLLSIVTQVELENGVYRDKRFSAMRRDAVDLLLATFAVLPFDADAVREYRGIVASVGFSRRKIADHMVAATALVHGLTLITMNGKDFGDIPSLKLEIWPNHAG